MRIIRNIFCCLIPIFCVIALFLKLNGIDHIEFDDKYYNFMSSVLQNSTFFQFEIPNIPEIPEIGNGFVDALVGFLNGITSVINILSTILNVVIKMLSFFLGMFKTIIERLKDLFIGEVVLN